VEVVVVAVAEGGAGDQMRIAEVDEIPGGRGRGEAGGTGGRRLVKEELPDAVYFLGGVHPTFMWQEVLESPDCPVDVEMGASRPRCSDPGPPAPPPAAPGH
jgi:hypothetical protein